MLNVNSITKSFENHKVLNGVSFSINNGEIYGLIGKNGAGKTTLMNIIAGLSKSDEGSYSIGEETATSSIGYLPDIPAFFDYLTAQEYIDFLLMNVDRTNERKTHLLQLVGLKGNEKIKSMSRGMKQRLGVASALVTDPKVLLLDEPTSALDPQGRHELMEILKQLKADGRSIVLSTHILADMEKVCDKVGFLHDGVIKNEIRVGELLSGKQDSWEIEFEAELEFPVYNKTTLCVTPTGEKSYLFETADQKYLLQYLASLPKKIVSIRNKAISLDELFEEVCK